MHLWDLKFVSTAGYLLRLSRIDRLFYRSTCLAGSLSGQYAINELLKTRYLMATTHSKMLVSRCGRCELEEGGREPEPRQSR